MGRTSVAGKSVDVKYQYVHEKVQSAKYEVEFVRSQDMIANCTTKALARPSFKR